MVQPDSKVILIGIIALFSFIIIVFSWFQRNRVKYASMFGKSEHFAGRLLGILILATFIAEYFKLGYTIYGIIASFICWAIYLFSHTCEKTLYGHMGSRG